MKATGTSRSVFVCVAGERARQRVCRAIDVVGAEPVPITYAQLQSGRAGDFWNIGDFPMKTAPDRTKGRNTRHLRANENPVGQWNRYEIIADGDHVVLMVNGQVLNEARDCLETPGKICLQSEGAEIHFRNILLVPLGATH